ncbi:hypothetical protein Acsp04_19580 [Actinomadura sp. NBRC 104425]|nr:hypothetical protein Acsp04_19580 [Actinomadura sp. NBRC 104425]
MTAGKRARTSTEAEGETAGGTALTRARPPRRRPEADDARAQRRVTGALLQGAGAGEHRLARALDPPADVIGLYAHGMTACDTSD